MARIGMRRFVARRILNHKQQLAEGSETDQTNVSLQERGKRCPNLWVFLKNAHALNVDPVLMLSMVLARLRDEL